MGTGDRVERYQAGERQAVWHELRELGTAVFADEHRDEAQAVCDAMARRARHNVELIVARLTEQGFRFHSNDRRQEPEVPHAPPGDEAEAVLGWLEAEFDAVPPALRSWLQIVGDVWLVGTHPDWPDAAGADPLVIEAEGSRYPDASIVDYFDDELDGWREWAEQDEDATAFVLPLAPDRLHKDDTSGGEPYGLILPATTVDGLFEGETTVPFVDYLDRAFRHGGFPGGPHSPAGERITSLLAADLLPL